MMGANMAITDASHSLLCECDETLYLSEEPSFGTRNSFGTAELFVHPAITLDQEFSPKEESVVWIRGKVIVSF